MSTDLAETRDTNIVPAQDPSRFIEMAIQQNADIDKLEKLLALNERWEAKQAQKAFVAAMTKFQNICPVLDRTKHVNYTTKSGAKINYRYAPLSSIREQIKDALEQCGLSFRWEIDDKEEAISVTCIVTHIQGHSEKTYMSAYADDSGNKNAIQSRGSTVTYMQRYTLIGALGITSADSDDDGQSSGDFMTDKLIKLNEAVRNNFQSVYVIKQGIADGDLGVAAEAWYELTNDEKSALWVAPTKGGIFTTEERKIMGSDEFRKAHYGDSNG